MSAPGTADDAGRGRAFVDLVTGIERSMCTAVHTLPAVDHLAAPPAPPDADAWQVLEEHLAAGGAHAVVDSLREWRRLDDEFRASAHRLGGIRGTESEPGYQHDLEQRIEDVRTARARLRAAADDLLDVVAAELESS
jgi:hypothetical protein